MTITSYRGPSTTENLFSPSHFPVSLHSIAVFFKYQFAKFHKILQNQNIKIIDFVINIVFESTLKNASPGIV